MIKELFRQILDQVAGQRARISRADALGIARGYCLNNYLPWQEPVHVVHARKRFTVWTNFGSRGNNQWVSIDATNGQIRGSGRTSR